MTFSGANFSAVRSIVFVAIGSNLDHPVIHVQRAMQDIDALPETALMKTSSLYETAPVGLADQPVFVNAVVQVGTTLSAHELLRRLLAIEAEHGRLRNSSIEEKNAPRTLDLDILLFDELQIDERGLTVPHSRMHTRPFALVPLVEIAPDIVIPGKGVAKELLAALDRSGVALLQPEEY